MPALAAGAAAAAPPSYKCPRANCGRDCVNAQNLTAHTTWHTRNAAKAAANEALTPLLDKFMDMLGHVWDKTAAGDFGYTLVVVGSPRLELFLPSGNDARA